MSNSMHLKSSYYFKGCTVNSRGKKSRFIRAQIMKTQTELITAISYVIVCDR